MPQSLTNQIVFFNEIKVSPSRLRRKSAAKMDAAIQAIRKDGQQCPLIIDKDRHLLSDTASYLALKALKYDVVKAFTLTDTSPMAIRAAARLFDCAAALRHDTVAFNDALAFLGSIVDLDVKMLVLEPFPVTLADSGKHTHVVAPTFVGDANHGSSLNFGFGAK